MPVTHRVAHLNRRGSNRPRISVRSRASMSEITRKVTTVQLATRKGTTTAQNASTGASDQKMNLPPPNNVFPNLLIRSRPRLLLQLRLQQLARDLRVGLPLRSLHHLADEEAEERLLARAVRRELLRVRGEDVRHDPLDLGGVAQLGESLLLDDRLRALARA